MIPIVDFESQYGIEEGGVVINLNTGRALRPSVNPQNGYLYVSLWKNNIGKTVSIHRLVALHFIPNPENKPYVNHKNSVRTDAHKNNLEWCTASENSIHAYEYGFKTQEALKKLKNFELSLLLNAVIAGESMTSIASSLGIGLSRLTINLRTYARNHGLEKAFESALYEQKCLRNKNANTGKRLRVLQFTLDGEFIAEHPSITEAAKTLGKSSGGSISNALNPNKLQSKAFGYLWKYS